jgi:PAS domain S-box-containing protein
MNSAIEREQLRAQQRVEALTEQLRTREAELRLVMDAVPLLVSSVDKDERYRTVNRAYEDWFGLPNESLVGRTEEVIGGPAYALLRPHVHRALAGEGFTIEQRRVPYRHGGTRDVRVTFVPQRDDAGAVAGYVSLLEDVTERRLPEDEREALLAQETAARAAAEAERQKLYATFMQAPVAICMLEGPQHVFTFANPPYRYTHS